MKIIDKFKIKKKFNELKIFASEGPRNLGDMLNYSLLDYMGLKYKKSSPQECNLIMIGSILDQYFLMNDNFSDKDKSGGIIVWGSGFIAEDCENIKYEFLRPLEIYALRGFLSKKRCEKILSKELKNIALGDPGLLANKIIDHTKEEKRYDVGIIPHYIDSENEFIASIQLKKYSSVIIDITGEPISILKKIAQCRVILSSAMHGLIVADSFNIPNKWIKFSDNVIGRGYKFKDYYSVFDIDNVEPIDLRKKIINDFDIDNIVKTYSIKKDKVEEICNNLLLKFPKEISASSLKHVFFYLKSILTFSK